MDGIIVVDKPSGWTSFDVCAKLRSILNKMESSKAPKGRRRKVGHSGTLDPMATGVLVCFLGKATKSIQNYVGADKEYVGEMRLGVVTDTMDAMGKALNPKSETLNKSKIQISNDQIINIFKKYTGKQKQKPPMFSAKKINGKPLYKLARKGIEIERPLKDIEIYSLELVGSNVRTGLKPVLTFKVKCSKGTYIRVLANDIGDDLGCGAHLSSLRRTAAGEFKIDQAHSIDQIITLSREGKLDTIVKSYEQS